jgi:excisionase family DNA binding protein
LLTAREVAERLHVSTETILRWVRRGQLAGIRLPGGALRFSEPELTAWLEARAGRGARKTGVWLTIGSRKTPKPTEAPRADSPKSGD